MNDQIDVSRISRKLKATRYRIRILSVALVLCLGFVAVVAAGMIRDRVACHSMKGQIQSDGVCLVVPDLSK